MPRPRNLVPTYRRHSSGQAAVSVLLGGGRRKELLLGAHGSTGSRAEYRRICDLIDAHGGTFPAASADFTLNEALVLYLSFIENFYVDASVRPTGTTEDIKTTLRYLRRLFGDTPIREFGIPHFKAVRGAMLGDDRVRVQINKRCSQIRQFFRWAAEEGHVEASVLEGLRAVRPLAPGRSRAKEGKLVEPADPVAVEKALPFLPPAVAAVVRSFASIDRSAAERNPYPSPLRPEPVGAALDLHSGAAQGELAGQVAVNPLRCRRAGRTCPLARRLRAVDDATECERRRRATEKLLTYFAKHTGRLNYRERLASGWAIGSGAVEGQAKTLGLRLKARGDRWRKKNVRPMASLVCVRNSIQWEAYWTLAG